jgi:hypothetical protein
MNLVAHSHYEKSAKLPWFDPEQEWDLLERG